MTNEEIFGLPNIKNTCFLNAVVQLIYSYDNLREEIVKNNSVYSKLFSGETGFFKFPFSCCMQLIHIYRTLNTSYKIGQFFDCNEFLTHLIDDLKTSEQLITYDRSICANNSNKVSIVKCSENLLCLTLLSTIHESVCDFMMEKGETHVFKNDFTKLGNCVILSLKRFSTTFINGSCLTTKDSSKITINPEINMIENDTDIPMELVSFITHLGTYDYGHYICHRKIDNIWYLVNDDEIEQDDEPDFGGAYILLYKRINSDIK